MPRISTVEFLARPGRAITAPPPAAARLAAKLAVEEPTGSRLEENAYNTYMGPLNLTSRELAA